MAVACLAHALPLPQVAAAQAEAAAVRQRLAGNPIWQVRPTRALWGRPRNSTRSLCCQHGYKAPRMRSPSADLHLAEWTPPAAWRRACPQAEQGTGDPSQLEALRKKSELIQVGGLRVHDRLFQLAFLPSGCQWLQGLAARFGWHLGGLQCGCGREQQAGITMAYVTAPGPPPGAGGGGDQAAHEGEPADQVRAGADTLSWCVVWVRPRMRAPCCRSAVQQTPPLPLAPSPQLQAGEPAAGGGDAQAWVDRRRWHGHTQGAGGLRNRHRGWAAVQRGQR